MYVDISTIKHNGKSYTRYLLRQSYREQGKVKHRTLANLSSCSREEIDAIRSRFGINMTSRISGLYTTRLGSNKDSPLGRSGWCMT